MTWDPRNLGAPKRITHPPEPPAPPAPPPRSYELRLADWDDRRLTALTDGEPFHVAIPLPDCEEEVPLYAKALEDDIARNLFGKLRNQPKEEITHFWLTDTLLETLPGPVGSFTVKHVDETDDQVKGRVKKRLSPPFAIKMVDLSPTLNDAVLRYVNPSYPELTPEMIQENHRALVERPARTMRDMVDALQYGMVGARGQPCEQQSTNLIPTTGPTPPRQRDTIRWGAQGAPEQPHAAPPHRVTGPTGPCGPVGDDYQGADRD